MKKTITFFALLTFFILVSVSIVQAQVATLWTKTFGGSDYDFGYSVQQTTDGGYIITGYTSSFGAGENDVWLIKTNASGDSIWTKTYGGSAEDRGYSVQQTSDGGYIIVGCTLLALGGDVDIWLLKTDAFGDTLWTQTFGGSSWDLGQSVQQTSDEGYIIVASTTLFGVGNKDISLIKTNTVGDTLWTKTYGGSVSDEAYSVQKTMDEGYILVGYTRSFGAGEYDVWLLKTNASGDTLWTKTFGGIGNDYGRSIQQTTDGGYIIAGMTESFGAGDYDVWLIKTNASGDTLWTKTFGGIGNDYGRSIQQTTDGGYIIAGYTHPFGAGYEDVWLIKTNASGDSLWTKTYGGSSWDFGESVQQTTDGSYIVVGYTFSFGAGGYDILLIKTTPDVTNQIARNEDILPLDFSFLEQNYPNPFNPITSISFDLPKNSVVTLKIFNILGEQVTTLVSQQLPAGNYSYEWDGSNVASGIYLYRLETEGYVETKKMVLMK